MIEPVAITKIIESPVGRLSITEAGGAVVRIAWTGHQAGDPGAQPGETPLLARAAVQLDQYFAGERQDFDLPLAPSGTPFQRRVWTEMARIPFGGTASYGALARELGSVARAVGGACGANPIPIVIPCHRVLGAGGALGGFSGGTGPATKRALLELEGVTSREPDLFADA
ncbi:MAG: methylated-DNA--[protein]-cysteine S-methyltransferase [Alphaproteobacteria bacterium]